MGTTHCQFVIAKLANAKTLNYQTRPQPVVNFYFLKNPHTKSFNN